MRTVIRISLVVLCSAALHGCSSSSDDDVGVDGLTPAEQSPSPVSGLSITLSPEDGEPLTPRIRRTTAGVPHIDGPNLASVTAGLGYAQAQDNLCVLADGFVKVRGERAEFFGPGEDDSNVIADFSYLALGLREDAESLFSTTSEQTQAMINGFVAGYNHYLNTSDSSEWPSECRGAAWVRDIDSADLLAYYRWLAQIASGDLFTTGALLAAVPPGVSSQPDVVSLDPDAMLWENRAQSTASNAWGVGSSLTENGRGALLSNPHFPYTGALRLYQSHLTVPDEMNVNGAGLLGTAIPLIMINENLAWTHTNSSSTRFTLYRLSVDPDDPMSYIKDGESIPITARTLQINVANGTDTPTVLERDVYESEYGPMVSLSALTGFGFPSWSGGVNAYTYRDANADTEVMDTWLGLANADNLDDFQRVFENCGSTLWTNSTYADKDGNAYYIDSSSVPYLSDDTLASINAQLEDQVFSSLFFNGLVLLDGSTSRDDWIEGDCNGRIPFSQMPKLERDDFVQNSNSSYWSTNPAEFLTGFSPLYGGEEEPINARTRIGLSMLQNPSDPGFGDTAPAGDDGLFNAIELLDVIWNNRAYWAEEFLPEVRERCELIGDTPVVSNQGGDAGSVQPACAVLANWSGNYNAEAVGAHLYRLTLIEAFSREELIPTVDFDATDPVNTPTGLPTENRGTPNDPVLQSILAASRTLDGVSIALDATLGSVQTYTPSGGAAPEGTPMFLADSLPWHGGSGELDGAFNAVETVDSSLRENTLLPRVSEATIPGTDGLSETPSVGWRIGRGTSWHFGLQFDDDGPVAWGLTSYGQSTNPTLPWYREQSVGYSNKEPRPILFTEADIAAAVLPDEDTSLEIEF